MIAKEFELFLLEQEETFLTPAEKLAALIDSHNADHAILVLSQITYSRIPVAVVAPDYNITEVLHKLVDEPFLPVVDDEGMFQGIITRKSILKAVNALLHEFNKEYEIRNK